MRRLVRKTRGALAFIRVLRYDGKKDVGYGGIWLRILKRFSAPLLALALIASLLPGAAALEIDEDFSNVAGKTLDGLMASFMEEHSLTEQNFSICYYNTVTGEEYCFGETNFMVAASTYKLPLNLYYYELQAAGEISGGDYIPGTSTTLDNCHRLSLVDSNNEVSIAMLYNLGTFREYKEAMRTYFTMTDDEIDPIYYADNYYCTRMMMDCLKYLYEHAEDFPEMLDYMTQACPGAYFKAYLEDEVTIAHKYGSFEGAENDTGIIYASQPFLLAVYTQSVGELICAEAAELLYEYTEYQYACAEAERLAAEQAEAERLAAEQEEAERLAAEQADAERLAAEQEEAERLAAEQEDAERLAAEQAEAERLAAEAAQENRPDEDRTDAPGGAFAWWMIAVALGVFGVGAGIVALAMRSSKKYRGKHVAK